MFSNVDATSNVFEWLVFLLIKYSKMFMEGTLVTLYVATLGTLIGIILGLIVGLVQDAATGENEGILRNILVCIGKIVSKIYVELFRGTPMIVQGMIIYYGLRQAGVEITSITAGLLVMFLNTGAYMSETVRSGISAIDSGQREGALAMGLSGIGAMIFVTLPQAIRNIIPEMCNTFLTNLKMTSVLNVIGVSELFYMAKTAGGTYYKYFEAYLAIAVIYFVLCFVFGRIIALLEKLLRGRKDYVLAAEYIESEV